MRFALVALVGTWACRPPPISAKPPPAPPTGLGSRPGSPAQDLNPKIFGTAEPGTAVEIFTSADCGTGQVAEGMAEIFADPGLTVHVGPGSTTTFYARAIGKDRQRSACSEGLAYSQDGVPPSFAGLSAAKPISTSEVELSWTAATDNIDQAVDVVYDIYQSPVPGIRLDFPNAPSPVATTAPGATRWVAGNLWAGTWYFFLVRARDRAGNHDFNSVEMRSRAFPARVATAISAGGSRTCAVLAGGSLQCWGGGSSRPVEVMTGALSVATSGTYACVLLTDGAVRCSAGSSSQLDSMPAFISGLNGVTALAVGRAHACALLLSGEIRCWGDNSHGQLGDGTTSRSSMPVAASGVTTAVAVSAGGDRSCALLLGGFVQCWGADPSGTLGSGRIGDALVPTGVIGGAIALAMGRDHGCALLANHTVSCWGSNDRGQVSHTAPSPAITPQPIDGVSGALSLGAGDASSCAVLWDGTALCWGDNSSGQLGAGNPYCLGSSPPIAPALGGITAISMGSAHACALVAGGVVRCWGDGSLGQTGDGSPTLHLVPGPPVPFL